jgi:integrase
MNTTYANQVSLNIAIQAISFQEAARHAIEAERARVARGEITPLTATMFAARVERYLVPFFGDQPVLGIRYPELQRLTDWLGNAGLQQSTIRQMLVTVRKVLNWTLIYQHISGLPAFPKVKQASVPRGGFAVKEYLQLWHAARRLSQEEAPERQATHRDTLGGLFAKGQPLAPELPWLIGFMVNSFIRPSDLRFIQHQHVQVVRGRHIYLRLSLPETKKHSVQIITLRPAVRIYEALLADAKARGCGGPEDFLFLPQVTNRKTAMVLMDLQFRKVLEATNLRVGGRGQIRTLYSLRHTAITFRLLYGKGIDLLTLARNARTSVEMIEKFYASELTAEMNVGMLQSRRTG